MTAMLPKEIRPDYIAYFSMEVGLDSTMPTYSGGLGILAGDTLRAAADLGLPMIGITLLHRKGYFRQRLDSAGNQTESPAALGLRTSIGADGAARIRADIRQSRHGSRLALRLSAACLVMLCRCISSTPALHENNPWEQSLTDALYNGDAQHRLCQEIVLGMGGVAMLEALGYKHISTYHMNEGHAALLTLALLERETARGNLETVTESDREAVSQRSVFTTHTPVPAGHDEFSLDLVRTVLGNERAAALEAMQCVQNGKLNMTYLALRLSRYINGVAMRHGEISRGMFPHYPIDSITNGVHAFTWTAPPFRSLYDRYIPEWRRDNFYLRYAIKMPLSRRAPGPCPGQARDDRANRPADPSRTSPKTFSRFVLPAGPPPTSERIYCLPTSNA